jgi:lipopolysaccharide transport system ATP-binding protein
VNDASVIVKEISKAYKSVEKANDLPEFALENISFELNAGDICGLIGSNGSGKSTLFKMLGSILKPDSGTITLYGKTAAILELGAGFHPDYTGYENIFFYANTLGFSNQFIASRLEAILEFSGLQAHINMPVKNYSSGMFMRLAFAIVTHLDIDILLLDEVLAVGDAAYKLKCMKKIAELSKTGVTILLISHDFAQISEVANKCLFLNHGVLKYFSNVNEAIDQYISSIIIQNEKNLYSHEAPAILADINENKKQTITCRQVQLNSTRSQVLDITEAATFTLTLEKNSKEILHLAILLKFQLDQLALTSSSMYNDLNSEYPQSMKEPGVYEAQVVLPPYILTCGNYFLDIFILDDFGNEVESMINIYYFKAYNSKEQYKKIFQSRHFSKPIVMKLDWRIGSNLSFQND